MYLLYKVFPPKAVFSIGMSALLFLFGFVISCQMFYLGLSGVMVSAVMPVSALSDLSWNVVLSGGRGTQGWERIRIKRGWRR